MSAKRNKVMELVGSNYVPLQHPVNRKRSYTNNQLPTPPDSSSRVMMNGHVVKTAQPSSHNPFSKRIYAAAVKKSE